MELTVTKVELSEIKLSDNFPSINCKSQVN